MAEKWTNTSSPFSRWIKPNPLAALNHFTVPVSFIFLSFFLCDQLPARIERERYSQDDTRTSKYVPTDSTACKGCKSLKRYHVCVGGYNCGNHTLVAARLRRPSRERVVPPFLLPHS